MITKERYLKAIQAVFPDWQGDGDFARERFEDVPGWDSMNGVNLQVELEGEFNVDLANRPVDKSETLEQFFNYLQSLKPVER